MVISEVIILYYYYRNACSPQLIEWVVGYGDVQHWGLFTFHNYRVSDEEGK